MKGKIAGYAPAVIIRNAKLIVSEPSRQRVIKEKRKNVHAFCCGELFAVGDDLPLSNDLVKIDNDVLSVGVANFN